MKITYTAILFIGVTALLFSCEKQSKSNVAKESVASPEYKPDLKSGVTSSLNSNGNAKSYAWSSSPKNSPASVSAAYTVVSNGAVSLAASATSTGASAPPELAENHFISSSAAIENDRDSTHRFIRTVDMKFRVKNVYTSSISIEDIVRHFGGFVTYTHIASTIDNTTITPISSDSSLESIYYTISNSIILRVPSVKLDSALRTIAANIDYLDFRKITAEDVAPQLLADRMKQARLNKHNNRLSSDMDKGSHKLGESTDAEQSLLDKEEEVDNAKLNAMSLTDRIKFSTVNLDIYQRPSIKRQIIANDKNIRAYEPPLGSQIADAFKTGWKVLCQLLLMLIYIWPLVAIAVAGLFAYRMWWKK